MDAKRPKTSDLREYHLHTKLGDLSPLCVIVGAPGRVDMIANNFFEKDHRFSNDHRGLVSCTGIYKGVRMSATTSGMGGTSMGIVLPEAWRSGARIFIRVGSCGTLIRKARIGDPVIVTGAWRYDGVSIDWAPIEFPAFADYRVVLALTQAAQKIAPRHFHTGLECTTADFNVGQGRLDTDGKISTRMRARFEEVLRLGSACLSMEAAALFVWCATHGGGFPAGAVNQEQLMRYSPTA